MNPDTIFEKVKEVIVEQLGVEDEAVTTEKIGRASCRERV